MPQAGGALCAPAGVHYDTNYCFFAHSRVQPAKLEWHQWLAAMACCRSRLRCALTLSRDDLDRVRASICILREGYM
jgi:hypothetical protein